MSRRIDIELTSTRDDGSWTWRAAGAREPRGTIDGGLLPAGASVGDVLRVEVEGYLDGIEVTAVVPTRAPRREPDRLEIMGSSSRGDDQLVTTQLAGGRRGERGGGRGRDRDRGERSERGERGDSDRRGRGEGRDGRARDGRSRDDRGGERRGGAERGGERRGGGAERGGERGERRDRRDSPDRGERHERPAAAAVEAKPKPKRLRPGRTHRAALLDAVPVEQRPILEQLLQGGIPAVRQAIDKQNEELKAAGKPEVGRDALLKVAEDLRSRAAAAVWRDRAEAAVANVDELDLRDLRSVVNAASDAGRDEEARALATRLREALVNRVEKEQSAWLAELSDMLREGRTVRALRLSSRPPKAGAIIPADLSNQLVEQTNAALTEETGQERWATVLDALAYSPIRRRVIPTSLPAKLSPALRETVARLGTRLPEIAHIFAVEPDQAAARPNRPQRGGRGARGGGREGGGGGRGEGGGREGGRSRDRGGRQGGPGGASGGGGGGRGPRGGSPTGESTSGAKATPSSPESESSPTPSESDASTPATEAPEATTAAPGT